MARPPQEAIDTFVSITGADEALAVRRLEVPPTTPLPFSLPAAEFRLRNLAESARLVADLVAPGRALGFGVELCRRVGGGRGWGLGFGPAAMRCDAMSWGRVAPDLRCGLINTHGFLNRGVASHCWNYLAVMEWNYAAKSRAFSCPLAIFAHYKSSKLFSPEKKTIFNFCLYSRKMGPV